MTCDQMPPLLEAFADGELGWGTAWRVRRHLAACPACASELAELQRLATRVRAWRDMPAPAPLQSRLAAALPAVPRVSTPRRPTMPRRAAVGLAGVAAAAAAFVWLLPGQLGRPTIAFADVEKAMASVNIMAWTTEVTHYNKDGTVKDHGVSQTWMRRRPLAQATIPLPEPSHPQGLQTLEDERGFLDILPNGKGIVWRGRTNVSETVAAYLSLFTGPLRMLERGQLGENGQSSDLEQTTLNGKPALKVVLLEHIPNELRVAFWIDPVTKRVIQMETRSTANGKLQYVVTQTQMRYDETPPPGVFDIVPPPGARIKNLRERPTPVMTDVERAMQQVQGVSYEMNSHVYDAQGRVVPGVMLFSFHRWLRRTPAASAQYDAVLHERQLEDARGTVWHDARLDKYLEQPSHGDIEQSVNKYMRRLTEPPTEAGPEEQRSSPDFHFQPWQRQKTTVHGDDCLMFTQEVDRRVRTGDGGTAHEFTRTTIWVDAQTLHVIRIELVGDPTQNVAPKGKGRVERTVFDNFHYDETPPPGVFDWSPPPGANVRGHW